MIPSHVMAGQPATAEIGCEIGSSGCWQLESLEVREQGGIVDIVGSTLYTKSRGAGCFDTPDYAFRFISLPPLSPGTVLVRAGDLLDTLQVAADSSAAERRITFREPAYRQEGRCGLFILAGESAFVSGLPDTVPHPRVRYLVRGTLSADDPCGLAGFSFPAHYFVTAREVTPD
ncbi:MAG: hypothetical protein U0167_03390 [bacterium]